MKIWSLVVVVVVLVPGCDQRANVPAQPENGPDKEVVERSADEETGGPVESEAVHPKTLEQAGFSAEMQLNAVMATVRVINRERKAYGNGSGVIVGRRDGFVLILTADHVVADAVAIHVHAFTAATFPKRAFVFRDVAVLQRDRDRDLAILRINDNGQLADPVELVGSSRRMEPESPNDSPSQTEGDVAGGFGAVGSSRRMEPESPNDSPSQTEGDVAGGFGALGTLSEQAAQVPSGGWNLQREPNLGDRGQSWNQLVMTVGCGGGKAPTPLLNRIVGSPMVRRPDAEKAVRMLELEQIEVEGRSGGPMFDLKGRLLGISSGTSGERAYYCPVGNFGPK